MDRIASFSVNHDLLEKGMYISRVDGDVVTYDIRMKKPNGGDYLAVPALHSIEHLVATAIRNGREKDKVVYFGPMGCRTGCYLLLKGIAYDEARILLIETVRECLNFSEVPGAKREECGNYLEQDLDTQPLHH